MTNVFTLKYGMVIDINNIKVVSVVRFCGPGKSGPTNNFFSDLFCYSNKAPVTCKQYQSSQIRNRHETAISCQNHNFFKIFG